MNLSGLAFVGQGYDQGAEAYWKRQQLENQNAELAMLGRAFGGGNIGDLMQAPTLQQPQMPMQPPMGPQPVQQGPPLAPPQQRFNMPSGPGANMPMPIPQAMPSDLMGLDPRSADMRRGGASPLPDANPGFVNPSRVGGQSQNLTGPIIPPGGFGSMGGAPDLGPKPVQTMSMMRPQIPGTPSPMAPPGPPAMAPPPQAQPPAPPMAPNLGAGGPPMSQMSGPQTWQAIVQRIKDANPGAPPELLAGAALKAIPLMQMMTKQEQFELSMRLKELQMQFQAERLRMGEDRLQMQKDRQTVGEIDEWAKRVKDYDVPLQNVPINVRSQVNEKIGNDPAYKGTTGYKAYQDYTAPNSKTAMLVKSQQTALSHLETLRQLALAEKNGDYQFPNSIRNWWRTQTGSDLPTNFNAARQIVYAELIKAVVPSGGGVSERMEGDKNLSANASPQQILGAIDKVYKPLLAGQRETQKKGYETTTGRKDFDEKWPIPEVPAAAPTSGTSGTGVKWKLEQ